MIGMPTFHIASSFAALAMGLTSQAHGRQAPIAPSTGSVAAVQEEGSDDETERLRGDLIEAEAMAFLAARSRAGLPITFPGTTGASAPLTGGVLYAAMT